MHKGRPPTIYLSRFKLEIILPIYSAIIIKPIKSSVCDATMKSLSRYGVGPIFITSCSKLTGINDLGKMRPMNSVSKAATCIP